MPTPPASSAENEREIDAVAPGTNAPAQAQVPLRPALKTVLKDKEREGQREDGGIGIGEGEESTGSGVVKAVSIASEPPQNITPLSNSTPVPTPPLKQFKTNISEKRMTGRPTMLGVASGSRVSLMGGSSVEELGNSTSGIESLGRGGHEHRHHLHRHHHHHHGHANGNGNGNLGENKVLGQVYEWLKAEKEKRNRRKEKKRRGSGGSESGTESLERLQRILEDSASQVSLEGVVAGSPVLGPRKPSNIPSRRRSTPKRLTAVSSDTEYQDGDVVVPSCDVVLDNSKTMSYSGGASESSNETTTLSTSKRAEKEKKAWHTFKSEILKLAHTLRLKGWRRVPLERGGDIEVERLSGALTNAVYVVSPPKDLPLMTTDTNPKPHSPRPPPKLLLRIYGPQVEHLIDRENELGILRRLARKRIGPRLLGTFRNGRFEEYFNAQTLKAADLRVEDTSKQIAKRMRELHDGIELLEREREEGPFVFRNWDKWVDHCQTVITYLDKEILSGKKGNGEAWRSRGLVCGVEWPQFKDAIDKYRKWVQDYYGTSGVNRHLIFAHNDTQYGNLLRLIPEAPSHGSAPSPLLLPQNTHKQLVVIDFEYASANTPGLEFANHFTEWCYNYHDPNKPWSCDTNNYPTLEQQKRFIRSYVNHRPQFNPRASATPKMAALDGFSKGSISELLLDSRTPGGSGYVSSSGYGSGNVSGSGGFDLGPSAMSGISSHDYREEEAQRERETERQVQQLLKETRIWRVANSAQWVAWGIVQAKVPELDNSASSQSTSPLLSDVTQTTTSPLPLSQTNSKDNYITATTPTITKLSPPLSPALSSSSNSYTTHRQDKRPEALLLGEAGVRATGGGGEVEGGIGEGEAEEEEFDYLAYAQDRAMFFWGDVVGLGIVDEETLPVGVRERLKRVEY